MFLGHMSNLMVHYNIQLPIHYSSRIHLHCTAITTLMCQGILVTKRSRRKRYTYTSGADAFLSILEMCYHYHTWM